VGPPEIPSWMSGNVRAGKGREERGRVGDGRVREGSLRLRIPGSLFYPSLPRLNGVIAYYLFCIISLTSIALQTDYVTVVKDRPIMSAKYHLPVIFDQN